MMIYRPFLNKQTLYTIYNSVGQIVPVVTGIEQCAGLHRIDLFSPMLTHFYYDTCAVNHVN